MDDNTVHIGTGESNSWWRRLTKRTVVIPVIALLFVGVGVWVVLSLKSTSEKKEGALDSAIKASDAAFQSGDYQKSIQSLQGAVDDAQSKNDKLTLYSQLAAAEASQGNMAKAIQYLEERHKIDANTKKEDAHLLGSYYERVGDNPKAVEWYKVSLEYLKSQPKSESNDNKIESLEVRIESLGG